MVAEAIQKPLAETILPICPELEELLVFTLLIAVFVIFVLLACPLIFDSSLCKCWLPLSQLVLLSSGVLTLNCQNDWRMSLAISLCPSSLALATIEAKPSPFVCLRYFSLLPSCCCLCWCHISRRLGFRVPVSIAIEPGCQHGRCCWFCWCLFFVTFLRRFSLRPRTEKF
jgi:hypothetical protein